MKTSTKFVAVPMMALTLLTSGAGFQVNRADAFGTAGQKSAIVNPATGFPLWYEDVTGGGGNKLQLCLGTDANGVGPVDPKCILPGQPSPINPITDAATNFPGESFYWFAEAPLTINGAAGRFRMALEAAFTGPAAVNGQQIVFARASLFTSQDAVFTPGDYTVTYPFGTFTFTVDALGAMTQPNGAAAFQPNGGGAKEMRAEDGPGLAGDFAAVLALNNTGITKVLTSTVAPAGYLGDGVTEAPVTGGTNGNVVTIAGPSTITGGTNWIVAGKLFAPSVVVTPQTVFAANANTVTGTISDPTSTVNVTVGANTNVVATVNPDGTWSATLPTPLGTGKFDVTVITGLGTANESSTTVANALSVNPATTSIYRLYNTRTGAQVYTRGDAEREFILNKFTDFEFTDGVAAFNTTLDEQPGLTPIFRLYNTRTGMHLYTRGVADRDFVLNKFTDFEFTDGVPAFYASLTAQPGLTPMFRLFETNIGAHVYARGEAERAFLLNKFPAFEFTDGVPAFFGVVN